MQASDDDNSGDFTDLLFDQYGVAKFGNERGASSIEDLTSLFGEDLLFGGEPEGSGRGCRSGKSRV